MNVYKTTLMAFSLCLLSQSLYAQPVLTEQDRINHDTESIDIDPSYNKFGHQILAEDGYLIAKNFGGGSIHGFGGPAYVFDAQSLEQLYSINPASYPADGYIGSHIDIDNAKLACTVYPDTFQAGPKMVFIIDLATGDVLSSFELLDMHNESILFATALKLQGDFAYVGVSSDDTADVNAGAIYIYNIETGELVRTILNPLPSANAEFGQSLALTDDVILAGDPYGIGGQPAGRCHAFDLHTGELLWTHAYEGGSFSTDFGERVAVEGEIVAVTAPRHAQVLLLDLSTGDLIHTIELDDFQGVRGFITEMDIEDGILMVGTEFSSYDMDTSRGVSFFYNIETAQQLAVLVASDGRDFDHFGNAVTLENGIGFVGAYLDNALGAIERGTVYVFQVPNELCFADINRDGFIDFIDVLEMIKNQSDLNVDGRFNFFDIALMIQAHGTDCQP